MPAARFAPLRPALIAVLLVGTATILGAWAFQYQGYVPCPLCLQQRIPYYVGIPLAALVLVAARRAPASLARLGTALVGLVFLTGAGLAAYHAGVEWHWWPGPSDCAAAAAPGTSAGTLLQSLNETVLVRCDEAAWRLAGLSLAGWNFVISLALAGVCLGAALKR